MSPYLVADGNVRSGATLGLEVRLELVSRSSFLEKRVPGAKLNQIRRQRRRLIWSSLTTSTYLDTDIIWPISTPKSQGLLLPHSAWAPGQSGVSIWDPRYFSVKFMITLNPTLNLHLIIPSSDRSGADLRRPLSGGVDS